ncbi:MAG: dihydropteroate synthase [Paramuribaculum sp.]|nr:dihydropteroate synthase [Paramuribaculum sp.]
MKATTGNPFTPFSLNLCGRLLSFERPAVMGIINATPDSFYFGSRVAGVETIAQRALTMAGEGADIIDVGGCSTRPGAGEVSVEEETARVVEAVSAIRAVLPAMPLSVDTYRASVAREAIAAGADIVNDISGGDLDTGMIEAVAEMRVPYILMHMRGTPATMQQLTDYADRSVTQSVITSLAEKVNRCVDAGLSDIIIDPGFGFAKTLEQNYQLMRHLPLLKEALPLPLLVGVSRKSMITRPLGISADEALAPTASLNTIALTLGASILRVHDVKAAAQAVTLTQLLYNS